MKELKQEMAEITGLRRQKKNQHPLENGARRNVLAKQIKSKEEFGLSIHEYVEENQP